MDTPLHYTFTDSTGEMRRATLDVLRQWHAEGRISLETVVHSESTGKSIPLGLLLNLKSEDIPPIPQDSTYEVFADKIGFVPNAKKADNLLQLKLFGIVWLVCLVVGAIWGVVTNPNGFGEGLINGLIIGGLSGLVVALLVSGAIVGTRTLFR
jgi:hypothetical protein